MAVSTGERSGTWEESTNHAGTAWQYYRTDGRVADDAGAPDTGSPGEGTCKNGVGNSTVPRRTYESKVLYIYTGLASHPQRELIIKQQSGHTGLLSFELESTTEQAKTFCQALKIFKIGVSWGGYESLVTMPYARETEETPGRWEPDKM